MTQENSGTLGEYQAMRGKYQTEYGITLPDPADMLIKCLNNKEKSEAIKAALQAPSLAWAEDFMNEYGMHGWRADEEVTIGDSFESLSIVARITLRDGELAPGQKRFKKEGGGLFDTISIDSISPTRDDNDRTAQMRGGMIHQPEEGVLILWKSWELEELDSMGIELPWNPPEDFDREPVEE